MTFRFLGWMTHDTDKRSVMSSTVHLQEGHLVSVMRRKHEQSFEERPSLVKNWIEAADSRDHGRTWTSLGSVAETDHGERNGNPPALVSLPDGRLVLAYGYRGRPYGIRMKVSEDGGKSWGKELVVRRDGATWDLGYPRMVLNGHGQILLIYYFTTEERYEQHIEASIIDPGEL
jgi:Neuraminidase (sialidase)